MKPHGKPPFDPKMVLAKVGEGRTIADYQKNQKVFSQGDPADAIFYIQDGKAQLAAEFRLPRLTRPPAISPAPPLN